MNRMLGLLCVAGLIGAGAVALGQTGPAKAPPGSAYAIPAVRTLAVPPGNYTLLVFTNTGRSGVTANITIGKDELAFVVDALTTLTVPLGASTSIPGGTRVKYTPVTVQPGAQAPAGEQTGVLTGWGAADGALVAFGDAKPPAGAAPGAGSGPRR